LKLSHVFSQIYLEEEERGPSIDESIIPALIKVLQKSLSNLDIEVKFNSLWCITNMAATKYELHLSNLIPELLQCLNADDEVFTI
jgi:hypothetical protein